MGTKIEHFAKPKQVSAVTFVAPSFVLLVQSFFPSLYANVCSHPLECLAVFAACPAASCMHKPVTVVWGRLPLFSPCFRLCRYFRILLEGEKWEKSKQNLKWLLSKVILDSWSKIFCPFFVCLPFLEMVCIYLLFSFHFPILLS